MTAKDAPLKKNKVNFNGNRFMFGWKNLLVVDPALFLNVSVDDIVLFRRDSPLLAGMSRVFFMMGLS